MDIFTNKLNSVISSVSTTVDRLSNVLPGNPLIREYDVLEQNCSGGPGIFSIIFDQSLTFLSNKNIGLLWKVYKATKKTTKQEASVFVFEKKQLERYSKDDREQMMEILKKSVVQLTKLRHPHVLTVQHPLEESRDSLAFATEPCFASLANVLGNVSYTQHKFTNIFNHFLSRPLICHNRIACLHTSFMTLTRNSVSFNFARVYRFYILTASSSIATYARNR